MGTMKDWSGEQFLAYARANMKRREFRQRMKQANYDKWDDRDLANLLCLEATGHPLELKEELPESSHVDEEDIKLPVLPEVELPKGGNGTGDSELSSQDARDVALLYEEYMSRFDMPEPNDRFMIKQLCLFQVAMAKANRNYLALLDGDESQSQLKAAAEQLDKITHRVVTLQEKLGIDKVGRGAEADSGEKLMEYAKQARHILHRQGIPLICVSCARSEDRIVNLYGTLLWHFQFDSQWRFEFECPHCHQKMTYTKENLKDLKTLANWK